QPFPPIFLSHPPPPTALYTLSLHDALPIFHHARIFHARIGVEVCLGHVFCPQGLVLQLTESANLLQKAIQIFRQHLDDYFAAQRSEEHTSELQSLRHLVCRLLLEKQNHIQH